MGNKLARNRLKAQDFHYIAKNTAFLTNDVSTRADVSMMSFLSVLSQIVKID